MDHDYLAYRCNEPWDFTAHKNIQLPASVAQVVEHLPRKQYAVGLNPTRAAFFSFSMEKEMFRLIVLPCFDLCRSNSFHAISVGV